jgi:hypothetical protein
MVQTLNSGQLPSKEDFGKLDKFKNDQLDSKWQTPFDTTATGSLVEIVGTERLALEVPFTNGRKTHIRSKFVHILYIVKKYLFPTFCFSTFFVFLSLVQCHKHKVGLTKELQVFSFQA